MPYLFYIFEQMWLLGKIYRCFHRSTFRHKQSQKCYPKISTYREKCLTLNRKNVLTRQHNYIEKYYFRKKALCSVTEFRSNPPCTKI
uniref:Uncharacterized protein n=1 Tax=Anguilla anguilla TaxID=7936 RepID=A0A0E9T483_ANGAN